MQKEVFWGEDEKQTEKGILLQFHWINTCQSTSTGHSTIYRHMVPTAAQLCRAPRVNIEP